MSGSYKRGVSRVIAIAQETTFGTLASGTGRQLRRVNFTMSLNKDAYQSNEILPSMQLRDARHGIRRVNAAMNGQLSPGSYTEFFENMLRKTFVAGATAASLTITAVVGPPGTFSRASGSWLTDGFKVGDIVRFTGFTAGAVSNNAKNYRISDLTATLMTVSGVSPETVVAAASAASITCTVVGKKTFVPPTGHVFLSHTIEDWNPDGLTATSNRGLGMTMQTARLQLPPTGFATLDFQLVGQDMPVLGTQAYASATAPNSANSLAAVNGRVRFNGADVAYITGATFAIACPVDAPPVVGNNITPAVFAGVISVSGSLNALLADNSLLTLFDQEQEVDLHFWLTTGSTANSDFMSFVMNRVKLMSNQRNDSDRALMQSMNFSALEHVTGTGSGTKFDSSTIIIQDSLA